MAPILQMNKLTPREVQRLAKRSHSLLGFSVSPQTWPERGGHGVYVGKVMVDVTFNPLN